MVEVNDDTCLTITGKLNKNISVKLSTYNLVLGKFSLMRSGTSSRSSNRVLVVISILTYMCTILFFPFMNNPGSAGSSQRRKGMSIDGPGTTFRK